VHYHDRLLAALPGDCRRVVDVGCGVGTFARRLARVVEHVDAIDRDCASLAQATRSSGGLTNVRFIHADFLTWNPEGAYDAISMVAVLHHLPFRETLVKAAGLLRPGGVLLVLGLDRSPTFSHYLITGAVATLISGWYRAVHPYAPVTAPIAEPQMTLREIAEEAASLLPGAVIRRHALLRYSLIWSKPSAWHPP
jgi:2-polyprenyl-3-methyl-5-hydroxy-6-metoxy-1,4-benzoquinol methylase